MEPDQQKPAPRVFVFNPFEEGVIAHGKGFAPVKHQVKMAQDLANLPQFLSEPQDVVLVDRMPDGAFLDDLNAAGFESPEFGELTNGRIGSNNGVLKRKLAGLRPWAWGPASLELLKPLIPQLSGALATAESFYNEQLAPLYSKSWSAAFLAKALSRFSTQSSWLCTEHEAGVTVKTMDEALAAIQSIRRRGHHRVVAKESFGLAGHNAIRLWEPEILPAQLLWLASALGQGRDLVIEPWLERLVDFSIHLEMEPDGLKLCGYTGLLNDLKGQFLANWAEPDYRGSLPGPVIDCLSSVNVSVEQTGEVFDQVLALLAPELKRIGFLGPISIDAFVYKKSCGSGGLKPIVEINPRYTMGRLALELMRCAAPGSYGVFQLVTSARVHAEGFPDLSAYAASRAKACPLRLKTDAQRRIEQGAICLNDPDRAQACLAIFEAGPVLPMPLARISNPQRSRAK